MKKLFTLVLVGIGVLLTPVAIIIRVAWENAGFVLTELKSK